MSSQHSPAGSSAASSSPPPPPPPPPTDADSIEPATPPARTASRGILFTSTLPQSHKRRPHPSQLHLKPITVLPPITKLHPPATDPTTDPPIPVTARSIPRSQPSAALPPSLHRTASTTLMVVLGLGVLCAFGGVQLYQLSKDDKARTRMERARRKTISYLDETIGGKRAMESEHDRDERRRQEETEKAEKARKEKEVEGKKETDGGGWRRYIPLWTQAKG